jgi:hypothetical protein
MSGEGNPASGRAGTKFIVVSWTQFHAGPGKVLLAASGVLSVAEVLSSCPIKRNRHFAGLTGNMAL